MCRSRGPHVLKGEYMNERKDTDYPQSFLPTRHCSVGTVAFEG